MKNLMKEKLRSGQPVIGVSIMFPSPQLVEIVGQIGFDWVLIDCEHGAISLETVELMVMAAELNGITPIVRPSSNSPEAILRVMDLGAMGVQVPHINTADEARSVVEAVKYFPLGTRGLAARTRAAKYDLSLKMADYVTQANQETLICVQLEEQEALNNLDEIIQVEGIDVFFLGPSDLSQSLGHPGRSDLPVVQEAMTQAFLAITQAGKIAGSAGGAQAMISYRQQGVHYLYTHLVSLISSASTELFELVKT